MYTFQGLLGQSTTITDAIDDDNDLYANERLTYDKEDF